MSEIEIPQAAIDAGIEADRERHGVDIEWFTIEDMQVILKAAAPYIVAAYLRMASKQLVSHGKGMNAEWAAMVLSVNADSLETGK